MSDPAVALEGPPALDQHIETERLIVRSYRSGDGALFYAAGLRNREHLARYEAENFIRDIASVEQAEGLVQELAESFRNREMFFFGAFEKATGAFAAQIYIGPRNWNLPEIEMGYFVDCEHEGQGYVTEAARAVLGWAFDVLGAHRVSVECDDTNTRSAAVAERCGFTLEGHLRQNKRGADGTITGTLLYGLLRDTAGAAELRWHGGNR